MTERRRTDQEPTQADLRALWALCRGFIEKRQIICPEVCGEDRVILNASDFIGDICEVVGYASYDDEDDD